MKNLILNNILSAISKVDKDDISDKLDIKNKKILTHFASEIMLFVKIYKAFLRPLLSFCEK